MSQYHISPFWHFWACATVSLRKGKPKHTYTMGGVNLTVTFEEKDLGVIFDDKLEFDIHIKTIVKRTNKVLGMIKISFTCLDKVRG